MSEQSEASASEGVDPFAASLALSGASREKADAYLDDAEAEKYAPNWGRLHLKWGESLAYSGNKEEAAKQFTRAAALYLTPSEKFELATLRY